LAIATTPRGIRFAIPGDGALEWICSVGLFDILLNIAYIIRQIHRLEMIHDEALTSSIRGWHHSHCHFDFDSADLYATT